ncbi:MAG: hypothetical protein V3T21_00810, partial [Candidatus Margulisiibacteriota bacterium]
MKIPYYVRKRITNIIISIFMMAFLALTLLPIGWMVYSSLKDSSDIAIGKVGMRRAGRDVLQIVPEKEGLLVLSADGGINLCRASDLEILKHASHKTSASSFLVEDKYIWIASANKGLLRVSKEDFGKSKRFKLPLWGIDFHKVTTTYIKKEGHNLYVSLDYRQFADVLRF